MKSNHKSQRDAIVNNDRVKTTENNKLSESVKTQLEQMKREIKQWKVDECFDGVKIWDASHSKSKQMDKRIAETLIVDDLPFSHFEDIGFMRQTHYWM